MLFRLSRYSQFRRRGGGHPFAPTGCGFLIPHPGWEGDGGGYTSKLAWALVARPLSSQGPPESRPNQRGMGWGEMSERGDGRQARLGLPGPGLAPGSTNVCSWRAHLLESTDHGTAADDVGFGARCSYLRLLIRANIHTHVYGCHAKPMPKTRVVTKKKTFFY